MTLTEQQKIALQTAAEGREFAEEWSVTYMKHARHSQIGEHVCDGCDVAGCCRQPVVATWVDALPIALRLHGSGLNTARRREQLHHEGRRAEDALCDGIEADEIFDCVFLCNGRCSMYSVRPMICRVYFAFGDRSRCTPYPERTDGLRPKVCTADHTIPMAVNVSVAQELSAALGCSTPSLPWLRALPKQVANMLDALASRPEEFWNVVWAQCAMPSELFARMVVQMSKEPPDRVELEVTR